MMPDSDDLMDIQVNVTLRIVGEDIDPEAISHEMQLAPDRTHRKGEPISTRSTGVRKLGYWGITSSKHIAPSADANEHILWLVNVVTAKLPILEAYKKRGCIVDIWLGVHTSAGHGGPVLRPEVLAALATLGLEVNLDLYPGA